MLESFSCDNQSLLYVVAVTKRVFHSGFIICELQYFEALTVTVSLPLHSIQEEVA